MKSARNAHELELLVVALDHLLRDLADPCGVVLPLRLRLQRAAFGGYEQPRVRAVWHPQGPRQAEDARLVERLSGRVILLPIGLADRRCGGNDDPGLRAVDAGLPRIARGDEVAVPQLERVLAQVPDV